MWNGMSCEIRPVIIIYWGRIPQAPWVAYAP